MNNADDMKGKGTKDTTKAVRCARLASDRKAQDVVLLDVSGLSSFADYFVVCTGQSSRQVQGIADHVDEELRKEGIRALGIEGQREGHWILMDYGDVIVHVFYKPVRELYDLESLWSDAQKISWEPGSAQSTFHTA